MGSWQVLRAQPFNDDHPCVWVGCETLVPKDKFMCDRHWHKIPHRLQDKLWDSYRHQDWVVFRQTAVRIKNIALRKNGVRERGNIR